MNVFTPARVCAALASACTGVLAFSGADALPFWARATIGGLGLFCGGLVAVSGSIQQSK